MSAQLGRAANAKLPDNAEFGRAVKALIDAQPLAGATLEVRGPWRGGEALVRIPYAEGQSEAAFQAAALERELRLADPGCRSRNPAALCRALLDMGSGAEPFRLVLRLVRMGCEAALDEKARFYNHGHGGDDREEVQRPVSGGAVSKAVCHARDRWVTCGLIDRVHAAVARVQGCAPGEADGNRADGGGGSAGEYGGIGPLQPELRQCFEAIEAYLDIDLPGGAWSGPADGRSKADAVSDAVVNGEWEERPRAKRAEAHDEPRHVGGEELFLQMIETAIRR